MVNKKNYTNTIKGYVFYVIAFFVFGAAVEIMFSIFGRVETLVGTSLLFFLLWLNAINNNRKTEEDMDEVGLFLHRNKDNLKLPKTDAFDHNPINDLLRRGEIIENFLDKQSKTDVKNDKEQ
jgi:hypothetical protein